MLKLINLLPVTEQNVIPLGFDRQSRLLCSHNVLKLGQNHSFGPTGPKKNAESRGTACYGISAVALKGAVGFVSDVGVGPMGSAATYILWQDGRRLTIRNVAPTRAAAKKHGKSMFRALASQIVR